MQRIVVDLNEPIAAGREAPLPVAEAAPKKRSILLRVAKVFAVLILAATLVGAIGAYFYWQSLKKTPQYSLALIIDAARRDDQRSVDQLIDINAVVDDFLPQITTKALELYGRGLPPQTVAQVGQIAVPILPAVKERARQQLPGVIRQRTEKFENVPFAAIVLGADRYLDIRQDGDTAAVTSKIEGRPLEVTMRRTGDTWQISGVRDEQLAMQIAQKIGQEVIAAASKGGTVNGGESLGIKNLQDILKQAEGIFR
jgi:hypothetical protein